MMIMMMMMMLSRYRTCGGGRGGGGHALDALRRALGAAAKLLLVCHEHHLQTLLGCLALHSHAGLLLQAKYFLANHESVALPALLLVGDLALHLAGVRVPGVGVVAEGVPVIDVDHLVALLRRAAVVHCLNQSEGGDERGRDEGPHPDDCLAA